MVKSHLTVDARTLGLFRIGCGLLLLGNLYERTAGINLVSLYSNEGLLPNHYALFLPPAPGYWSLLLGFSSPNEVRVAMVAVCTIYLLYTLGWKTRWMQLFALIAYESVNNRFILIQHGGNVVVNIMLVWTLFLPLGRRFSIDALLASLRAHPAADPASLDARAFQTPPTSVTSLAYFGICFNFAAIYFFNALHKMGTDWGAGTVIHWVLWQNRLATGLAGWLRMHEPFWLSPLLTWGTLVVEWSLPALILTPWLKTRARLLAIALVWGLHGGIALLCTLGPFSYSMMVTSLLLLQPEHFQAAKQWLWARAPPRTVRYRTDVPRQVFWARVLSRLDRLGRIHFEAGEQFEVLAGDRLFAREAGLPEVIRALPLGFLVAGAAGPVAGLLARALRGVHRGTAGIDRGSAPAPLPPAVTWLGNWLGVVGPAAVLIAVISQLLMENWGVHAALKPATRPAWMTAIIEYLTIPQGWSMFAPNPQRDEGRLVVDATLSDGQHRDLLTGEAPDFEPWKHGPWGFDQHWCEIHSRMRNWNHHWRNLRDYLARTPRREAWPDSLSIVDFEVFWISSTFPPPGQTEASLLKKERLFGMRDWPL